MTAKQIEYIVTKVLHDSVNTITALSECEYFTLFDRDNNKCNSTDYRYKFVIDGDSCLVYCYRCKVYNGDLTGLTQGVHYDTFDNKTCLYLMDEYNNVLCDIYSGENIIQFCTKEVEV